MRCTPLLVSPLALGAFAALALTMITACDPIDEPHSSEDDQGRAAPDSGTSSSLPPPSSSNAKQEGDGPTDANARDGGAGSAASTVCKVSFKSVLTQIDQAGCASMRCHGTRFGSDPRLEIGDPALTYKALTAHKIGGKPYVKPSSQDPTESAMHCHLHGECGVKMPPNGAVMPKELVTVTDAWLACGAPKN